MPQSAREQVDITALIQGILNGYPGNSAILREYLQNSDDAGATKQIFILDERDHPTESLCDPSLCDAQGPALLAINDGLLSDSDWNALKKIHSSNKKADETQTGKNGLGFRASYHLTENPHVLSGESLMILDPHHRFQEHPGGISIDVVKEGVRYRDQLEPFKDVVDDIFAIYAGTVFRLPLRTVKQAEQSKIKTSHTSVEEIGTILSNFCEHELGEVLLFLKHITKIEIRHIDRDGQSKVIGSVTIEDIPSPHTVAQGIHFRGTLLQSVNGNTETKWCIRTLQIDKAQAKEAMSERLGYDVGDSLTSDKLSPLVQLASPINGELIGSLYTLLPLPIRTCFPLHLNAVFALTPDRQSLKNIEEVGTLESRERRLVEWNRVIFDVWTPVAWADLLEHLSSTCLPWSIWPPEEKSAYWANLTLNLTKEVTRRGSSIFPIISSQDESLVSLGDCKTLIASASPGINLSLLSELGLNIVQPPRHIFTILESGDIEIDASILSPSSLHSALADGYKIGCWKPHNPQTVGEIIEYLVFSSSPPGIDNLIGLPWFRNCSGSSVSLRPFGDPEKTPFIVPASQEESRLFADLPQMLAWDCFSDRLRSVLLNPGSSRILSVVRLQPEDVLGVIFTRFSRHGDGATSSSEVAWVLDFWTWLADWRPSDQRQFLDKKLELSNLYLLPTTSELLRRVSEKVIVFSIDESSTANVWEKLGVPHLHRIIPSRVIELLSNEGFIETRSKPKFVQFLLENTNPTLQGELCPEDFEVIRNSLYLAILSRRKKLSLKQNQREVLEQLSIFHVRDIGGGPSLLGSVTGTRLQVAVGDEFPLPYQKTTVVYVDIRDSATKLLVQLLEPLKEVGVFDLLYIALEHWDLQSPELQDRFIDHIFESNWRKLPPRIRKRLDNLPFVTVNGMETRVPPKNLIHPMASITPLFEGEIGRIPTGRFAAEPYLSTMHNLGFVLSSLDRNIVQERLCYLSDNVSDAFDKAVIFVRLLNQFWDNSFREAIHLYRDRRWLPLIAHTPTVSPNASRDSHQGEHADRFFYDFVLTVLRSDVVLVTNPQFRSALGWSDRVSTDILVRQLSVTLSLPRGRDRYNRLSKLITYMSQCHSNGQLSSEDIQSLRSVVTTFSWIPVAASSIETVATERALLSDIDLKLPFRLVHQMEFESFFIAMGCTKTPTLETMTFELRKYESVAPSDMPAVTELLSAIVRYYPDFDRTSISVPGQGDRTYPLLNVYYPDTDCLLPVALQDKTATHFGIPRFLSDQLGIPHLSSLLLDLGEDALEDDEQMGEALVDRIQGFLREYDIRYAFNEMLANADDARATELSIMLDYRRLHPPSKGMISKQFCEVQSLPSVILFDNAILSEGDFIGLRRVGRGGKVDQLDTHGRHGLGALSFYYFTDVVTVISGEYVMILDPSGRYLPPVSRGRKRTSLCRKISDIFKQYPNQFKSYEGRFNFSKDTTFYNGTLFFLPLNTKISAKSCDAEQARILLDSSYRELALNAFFFTNLSTISAKICTNLHENLPLWSFSAGRGDPAPLSNGDSRHSLQITSEKGDQTLWMISTSKENAIPTVHDTTAAGLKLTKKKLVVQLATRLDTELKEKSWLFSTLRLPRVTSLPFHLNARFAISSNRQSIVFDSPDSSKARDPKSDFNGWILTDIVPPLYLASLAFLVQQQAKQVLPRKFWFLKSSDDISKHVGDAFLSILATSDHALFKSIDGSLLSFKNSVFWKGDESSKEIVQVLTLLKAPRLVTSYVSSGLATIETARRVDAAYARDVLGNISLERIRLAYDDNTITFDNMLNLLLYIRQETPLVGLPLTVSSTNVPLCIPDTSGQRMYLSSLQSHGELFRSQIFLRKEYTHEAFKELWSSHVVNVVGLTTKDVERLISEELGHLTEDVERERWLKKFWNEYHTLPGPPSLFSLEQADVKLVRGTLRHYSLRECQPDSLVFISDSQIRSQLSPVLQSLGIDVIKVSGNAALKSYLVSRFPEPIVNVCKCLASKDITEFGGLSPEEAEMFKEWLKSSIRIHINNWGQKKKRNVPAFNRDHLHRLKIWTAYTSRGEVSHAALNMAVLPYRFSIQALIPFLLSDRVIAPYSSELCDFKRFCLYLKKGTTVTMSAQEILTSVEIPSVISRSEEVETFKTFLQCLFDCCSLTLASAAPLLKVYDTDGNARSINSLYDHTVPLFSTSLPYTPRASFIHSRLRNVGLQTMRTLGLNHEISVQTFRTCAVAVQAGIQSHLHNNNPTLDALREMSRLTFQCYGRTLPPLIMRTAYLWADLDSIAFIRAKNVRRQGASYPADRYCESELPLLLSPNQLVLSGLEPIAWTQRGLFYEEPSEDVTAVNVKLGVPEVREVVAHLEVLTTKIAPNHPGNLTLLSDINATYKWLNERAEQAKEFLVPLATEKLFLNVDDPSEEWWDNQWVAAQDMVLNFDYDIEDIKRVKRFLREYSNLLHASGCNTMSLFSEMRSVPVSGTRSTRQSEMMMTVFNEMRKSGELIDMAFRPTANFPIDILHSLEEVGGAQEEEVESDQIVEEGFINLDASTEGELEDGPAAEQTPARQDSIDSHPSIDLHPDHLAHHVILAAALPYIRDRANWSRRTLGQVEFINFNGTSFGAKALLDFIYTGDFDYTAALPDDSEGSTKLLYELLALLPIADEWNVPDLKAKVESEIIHKSSLRQLLLPLHNDVSEIAEKYQANSLTEALNKLRNENEKLLRRFSTASR